MKRPLLFALMLSLCAPASRIGADVATTAAVAAGTATAIQVVPPLFTKSSIEVKVEKYVGTPPVSLPKGMKHIPVALMESGFGPVEAAQFYGFISKPQYGQIVPLSQDWAATILGSQPRAPAFQKLQAELNSARNAQLRISVSIQEYKDAYENAVMDRRVTPAELNRLRKIATSISDEYTTIAQSLEDSRSLTRQFAELAGQPLDLPVSLEVAAIDLANEAAVKSRQFLNGLTGGVLTGPISNEAYQGLTAHGEHLDYILSDTRGWWEKLWNINNPWQRYNRAMVYGGTGDNDTVIYLENIFTPVIKKSRFSPDAFIAAQSQFYRSALNSISGTYGVPLSSGTDLDTNIYAIQGRKTRAEKALASAKGGGVKTLTALIEADAAINKPTPTADDYKKAATKLRELATTLRSTK